MDTWSRKGKAIFLLFIFWSAWSFARSVSNFEILGFWFYKWEDFNSILFNWLSVPGVVWSLVLGYDWVMKDNTVATPLPRIADPDELAKIDPMISFENELSTWPQRQAEVAREIIATTTKGNYKNFDKLGTELSPKQYLKVLGVVKQRELLSK